MPFSVPTAIRAATILCSAVLLFLVQPALVRAVLPRFGGSAGVWTAAMLLFQACLLAGYLYAYASTHYLSSRWQALLHLALLILSLLVLPLRTPAAPGTENPITGILWLLAAAVGLPSLVLSATSPLLQQWSLAMPVPYRLYAVSNFGSLMALIAYPLVIEPRWPVSMQLRVWSFAYGGFVILAAGAALLRLREPAVPTHTGWQRPDGLWFVLPACASALWLAVATHLTQDVAPVPLLWVLPLSIYLLSFVLTFSRESWYQPRLFRWLLPLAWAGICGSLSYQHGVGALSWRLPVCALALFVVCMFCHGELARRRPAAKHLAWYYVCIAAGGVAGSVFVAVIAPLVFATYLELPLTVVFSVVLATVLVFGYRSIAHVIRLAVVGFGAFLLASQYTSRDVAQVRNFYGALRVRDYPERSGALRVLYHGATEHGAQFQDPKRAKWPTAYYGPVSGAALAINQAGSPRRIGIVGLGAGALATYARTGDTFRFYEINPLVIEIAHRGFTFLRDSAGTIEVAPGDGRLTLEQEKPQDFDVLVLDAFAGDSIPVHLLTREAFRVYFRHIRKGGLLAAHITNRHLDLAPVVAASAEAVGKSHLLVHSRGILEQGTHSAQWMLIGDETALTALRPHATSPPARRAPVWTDDYSNLLAALL